jgi:Ser/Thr protein kinase RdoA (MazF antagonist)
MWLEALARDTDIGAPVPLRAPDGDAFVRAFAEGVSGPIRCTLMSWIPGVSLGRRLSVTTLTQMGALFARMHAHGAAFVPPEGFTTRHMNTYLAREELNVLFGPECLAALPHESQELLALTRAKVDAAFESRYAAPEGLRVIHNDLWHDNIKLHRGRLRPLDFEDTLWGYPVQDIAMAWLDLMDSVASGLYEPYTDAFRAGYESHTPWPERFAGEVDLFEAGRMLWVANYVARYQPQHLGAHIEWLSPRLASFLASGRVRHLPASV